MRVASRSPNAAVGSRLAKRFAKDAGSPVARANEVDEFLAFGGAALVESPLDGQDLVAENLGPGEPQRQGRAPWGSRPGLVRRPEAWGLGVWGGMTGLSRRGRVSAGRVGVRSRCQVRCS